MSGGNIELAVKLKFDGKDVSGGVTVAREDFRKLAIEAKNAGDAMAGGFTSAAQGVRSVSTMLDQAQKAMIGFFGVQSFARAADSWTNLKSRIDLVSASTLEAKGALAQVAAIAAQTGQSLDSVGTIWQRMARNAVQYNLSQAQIAETTRAVANAVTLSGASAASAQAALMQFGQALASGQLRGEELNSVMEQTPALAEAIARGMGKTVGELKVLGEAGQLTAEQVLGAIRRESKRLEDEAAGMALTIGRALQQLDNAWQQWAGSGSASGAAAKVIQTIADNFGALATAASIAGGAFAAFKLAEWARTATLAVGQLHPVVRGITMAAAAMVAAFEAAAAIKEVLPRSAFAEAEQNAKKLANEIDALVTQIAAVPLAVAQAKKKSLALDRDTLGAEIARRDAELENYSGQKNRGNSEYRQKQDELEALNRRYADLSASMKAMDAAMPQAGTKKSTEFMREYATEAGKANYAAQDAAAKFKAAYDLAEGNADERKRLLSSFKAWLVENGKKASREADAEAKRAAAEAAQVLKEQYANRAKMVEAGLEHEHSLLKQALEAGTVTEQEALDARYQMDVRALAKRAALLQSQLDATADPSERVKLTGDLAALQAAAIKASDAWAEGRLKMTAASEKFFEAQSKETVRLQEAVKRAQEELAAIGLTAAQKDELAAKAREAAAAQHTEAAAVYETARAYAALDGNTEGAAFSERARDAALAQADALKQIASLERQQGDKRVADEAANARRKAWEDFSRDIERSLTDALMRSFESGDNFGRAFVKNLQNTLKTTVLKVAVQAVVDPVTGALKSVAGLSGGSGGGAAGSSASGGIFSIASTISSLASGVENLIGASGTTYMTLATSSVGQQLGLSRVVAGPPTKAGAYPVALTENGTQVGSYFSTAGYAVLGSAIGTAIAGDKELWGMGGSIWSSIGAAVGTFFDMPFLGGVIGGALDAMFGMGKKKSNGQGIEGTFQGTNFSGNTYLNWTQKGGWFRSNKSGTDRSPVTAAVDQLLDSSFTAIKLSVGTLAESLALDTRSIAAYSKTIRLALSGNGAADANTIKAMFDGMANEMAALALAGTDYAKQGESAIQTLSRLSSSLAGLNSIFQNLGITLLPVSAAAGAAASALVDAMGGVDGLKTKMDSYFNAIYTDAERRQILADNLSHAFASMSLTMPTTRQGFKALVNSLDLTTAAGQKTFTALVELAPVFAEITDAVDAGAAAWQSLTDAILEEVYAIRRAMSGSSGASLASLQAQFSAAQVAALAGDQQAAGRLPELSRSLLTLAEASATSLLDLRRIQAQTANALEAVGLALASRYGLTLPAFAVGTNYVPTDMVAQIHAGERIIPAADNAALFAALRDPDRANEVLVAEVKALREELALLRAEAQATARNTGKTAQALDRAMPDGDALAVRTTP